MHIDALSAVFDQFEAKAVFSGGLLAARDWAIEFKAPKELKFFTVGKGVCNLSLQDGDAVSLEAGDVFVLNDKVDFTLRNGSRVNAVRASDLFSSTDDGIVKIGTADETSVFGSHVVFENSASREFMNALPRTIHIKRSDNRSERLQWLITELAAECETAAAGGRFAKSHFTHLIFLEIVRIYLAAHDDLNVGWLRGLFDPQVGPVMVRMQEDLARSWGLAELAHISGMSRTAFAIRFKDIAGVSPIAYLLACRMRSAERLLRQGRERISSVAAKVGYGSDAAFSTAYKRFTGVCPSEHRSAGSPM